MPLSDEILADPDRKSRLRIGMDSLARACGAAAAVLVDEGGTPFGTIGHVEFRLPFPLANLVEEGDADVILQALVGEPQTRDASSVVVERLNPRALLVVLLSRPATARARLTIRSRSRKIADVLGSS
jgi:hypothetical protein